MKKFKSRRKRKRLSKERQYNYINGKHPWRLRKHKIKFDFVNYYCGMCYAEKIRNKAN